MANILLGTLRDYWKGVYDAIATGGSAKKATGLQVAGSDGTNAQIIKTNADGEVLTQLSGSKLTEQKTNADAVANVITFSTNIYAIEIYHEAATWQVFIVNGITLQIPPGGYRTPIGGTPGLTVTIPAGLTCIVGRLV